MQVSPVKNRDDVRETRELHGCPRFVLDFFAGQPSTHPHQFSRKRLTLVELFRSTPCRTLYCEANISIHMLRCHLMNISKCAAIDDPSVEEPGIIPSRPEEISTVWMFSRGGQSHFEVGNHSRNQGYFMVAVGRGLVSWLCIANSLSTPTFYVTRPK